MKNFGIKCFLSLIATLSLAIAYAEYDDYDNVEDTLGYEQGHKAHEDQMLGAYNSPARIDVKGSFDIFGSASFIWYQPKEKGLNLGFYTDANNQTHLINTNFEYDAGFKVKLGMNTFHDNWVIFAEYTHLYTKDHAKKTAATGETIYPFWGHSQIDSETVTATEAKGTWDLKLNILDTILSRPYYVGTKFTIKTGFGVRAAWIDQHYKTAYTLSAPSVVISEGLVKSDSWVLGPRAIINTNYLLGCGFKLYSETAASLMYQHFKIKTDLDKNTSSHFIADDKIGYLTPNLEIALGLGWGSYFSTDKWHMDILAGYDFHIFWNQNFLRSFKDLHLTYVDGSSGDLMLQGLTITLRIDF